MLLSFLSLFFVALSIATPHTNAFAKEKNTAADEQPVRKFNDVLKDLLNEFAYDLKTNQVQGLKNLAVRRVSLSESIPKSYENYMENLSLERLRKYSKIRVIQCTMCRVKKTIVENGRMILTMPINNQTELDTVANQLNIETWLDVTLLYQESGMVLAYNAFDSKTKELLWTKTYNSEDLNKQVDEATMTTDENGVKKIEEESTQYVVALSSGWFMVANVKKPSNMLTLAIRMSEQFNNKHSEIGAMIAPIIDPNVIVSDYAANGDPSASDEVTVNNETQVVRPFSYGLALFATYHHNFGKDNSDSFRWGAHGGIGGIYAPGYITFTGRGGPVLKFGKRFFIEAGVNYSMPTTLSIKEQFTYKTKGGVGADATFGILF